jgi:hypothetical protein
MQQDRGTPRSAGAMITTFRKEELRGKRAFTSRQEIDVGVMVFVRGPRIVGSNFRVQAELSLNKLINTTDNMKVVLVYL